MSMVLQNDVSHGVRRCNVVLMRERRYKYMLTLCDTVQLLAGFFQCNGRTLEEAGDFKCALRCVNCWVIIHCLVASCRRQITRAACSWFDLVYNWLPNSELILNNSLLELIYFLISTHLAYRANASNVLHRELLLNHHTARVDLFLNFNTPRL